MKLALHQPYLFPYVGYFQLIAAVDTFVFYDDAAFSKGGWVNRNRLLVGGAPWLFSVPLRNASHHAAINATRVDLRGFAHWRGKFLRTISQSYADSPRLESVLALIEETLPAASDGLAALAQRSVEVCCRFLGIHTPLQVASRDYPPAAERGIERVVSICRAAGATHYVNAPGGRALYRHRQFAAANVTLSFLLPQLGPYPQIGREFVPALSVLDLLLRQTREAASALAARVELAP